MYKHLLKATFVAASAFVSIQATAQQNGNSQVAVTANINNGSFSLKLSSYKYSQAQVEQNLNQLLSLSSDYTFSKVNERQDKRGTTHASYQQYYRGIKIDGGLVLLHAKSGAVVSINGTVATAEQIVTKETIDAAKADAIAAAELGIVKRIKEYDVEKVIVVSYNQRMRSYSYAYKVRVDGWNKDRKIVMYNVYVDAATGKVLRSNSLIAHEDVTGSAATIYNSMRTIVSDSLGVDSFVLRDNGRKIETYEVGGIIPNDPFGDTPPFEDARHFNNTTANWGDMLSLMSISLETASDTMMSELGVTSGSSGNFITALVSKNGVGDIDDLELVTGYDVKYEVADASDLPTTSRNLYVPADGTPFTGIFAKADINFFSGAVNVLDTAYFDISDLTIGSHAWADAKGNSGSYTISSEKSPALDAHWGMEQTHDYYMNIFDRNSYDGEGAVVRNFINGVYFIAGTQNNAAALPDPYASMVYGLGDGVTNGAFVTLDVMGHEFTHMVTDNNGHGGLDYSGESGALNESFSDIFGTCIEFYALPDSANFNIGEKLTLTAPFIMRSMSNPESLDYPGTYLGDNWVSTSESFDNGGVHFNSSVPNKWFYLLCQGGNGTNDNDYDYDITAIGIDKAQEIAYLTLTEYLSSDAQFEDAYNGSLEAAAELYGDGSVEYTTVELAWHAVGVPDNDPTSLNNYSEAAKSVRLYPNPSTGNVTIESGLTTKAQASVFNIVGSKVMDITVVPGNNSFDFSGLSKGVYMIKYAAGNSQFVQKVVLK